MRHNLPGIHLYTNYGWTALLYAAERGYTEIVKLLISAGAEIQAVVDEFLKCGDYKEGIARVKCTPMCQDSCRIEGGGYYG